MSKANSKLFPKIFESLSRIEIDYIDKLLEQIENQNHSDSNKLKKSLDKAKPEKFLSDNDYNSYVDSLIDDFDILKEVNLLSSQLAIVALYRIVEIRTKSILKRHLKNSRDIKAVFRIENLIKLLKKEFGIELNKVKGFSKIDELRCLNNSIKHQGVVSAELSNFNGWKLNEKIGDTTDNYNSFAKVVPSYLFSLCEQIEKMKET